VTPIYSLFGCALNASWIEQSAPLAPLPATDEGAAPAADVDSETTTDGVEDTSTAPTLVVAIPVAKVVGTGTTAVALVDGKGAPPEGKGTAEGAPDPVGGALGAPLGPAPGPSWTHCE